MFAFFSLYLHRTQVIWLQLLAYPQAAFVIWLFHRLCNYVCNRHKCLSLYTGEEADSKVRHHSHSEYKPYARANRVANDTFLGSRKSPKL
ncbi:unnamed protein product [Caretta caretta]